MAEDMIASTIKARAKSRIVADNAPTIGVGIEATIKAQIEVGLVQIAGHV